MTYPDFPHQDTPSTGELASIALARGEAVIIAVIVEQDVTLRDEAVSSC